MRDGDPARQPARHVSREAGRAAAWLALLALVPAAATGAAAHYGAAQRAMWNNEYATWHAATLPVTDLARLLRNTDLVHTVYYLFMHVWISIVGDTPLQLRLPSIAAMTVAAGALTLVGRRLVNTPVGLMAGLIFAMIPSVTRYAQEARAYALVTMGAAVATLFLLRALDKPTWQRWLPYGLTVAAMGWLHFASLLVLAAHATFMLLKLGTDDRRFWQWAGAGAFAMPAVVPLLAFASKQTASISWIKADREAIGAFPTELFGDWRVGAAVVGLGLLGAALNWRADRASTMALLVWSALPPIFVLVTYPFLHLFLARYVLFTLPAWAILAAMAIYHACHAPSRTPRKATVVDRRGPGPARSGLSGLPGAGQRAVQPGGGAAGLPGRAGVHPRQRAGRATASPTTTSSARPPIWPGRRPTTNCATGVDRATSSWR